MVNPDSLPPDQFDYPKVSFLKRLRFMGVAYFFIGLSRLILGTFTVLKWVFAPVAFLFDIFILFPFGKFYIKIKATPAFQEIDVAEIPDSVWRYMEECRLKFSQLGFRAGRYVCNHDMMPNQSVFSLTMTNRTEHMGVGILYLQARKAKDTSLDLTSVEFSCVREGVFMDLTNNTSIEPFLPTPGRLRLVLDEYGDEQLYYMARKMQEKLQCHCNDKLLELLETNPRVLLNDEIRMIVHNNIKRGLMFRDPRSDTLQLTWKGAWLSTLQTLWPTSVLYRKKLDRLTREVFHRVGIDPDEFAWQADELNQVFQFDQPILSVADVLALTTPCAQRMGISEPPVSVSVNVSCDTGEPVIDIIDVRYEALRDYPERKMRARINLAIQLVMSEHQGSVYEKDQGVYSYEEYEQYGFEPIDTLPVNIDNSIDFKTVINRINRELNLNISTQVEVEYACRIENKRAVWCGSRYDDEQEITIYIDPFGAEVVERVVDKYADEED